MLNQGKFHLKFNHGEDAMAMSKIPLKKDSSEVFLYETRKAFFEALIREQMMDQALNASSDRTRTDKADILNLRQFNACLFLSN